MRIISLVPSATETLSAWDRTPVACTRFCERPDLAHVGGTKNPAITRIVALAPDLVVMDAEENRREDHAALVDAGVDVYVVRIRALDDVNAALDELAHRVGARWRPLATPRAFARRATAFIPIWRRPWMALGAPTYGASVLDHLGIESLFAADGPYPAVTLDEVRRRAPDLVVAPSEPYPFAARHLAELEQVAPTVLVDGRDLFWWGVRTEGALARLAVALAGVALG